MSMLGSKKKAPADHSVTKHIEIIKDIWNRKYDISGIERLIAVFLCCMKFCFPVFWIRHFTRDKGYRTRNRCIEIYMILKCTLLAYILLTNTLSPVVFGIGLYCLFDVTQYLLGLIFLSSIYTRLPSFRRNFAHLCMNLFEIIASFSIVYFFTHSIGTAGVPLQDGISNFYFSLVTFGTIGYGDAYPLNLLGKKLVIGEIFVSLLFITIIVSSFVSRLDIKNED